MNFAVTTKIDQDNERRLRAALEQFPLAVQDAIVREGMRPFLRKELAMIRALNAGKLPPKQARAKVKAFKGGVLWGSVAYKTAKPSDQTKELAGRAKRAAYDADGVGWRSHFTELGTHAWSSTLARPPRARGKGWKRGLYHRGRGKFIRGTLASEVTARAMTPLFFKSMSDAVRSAVLSRNSRTNPLKLVEEIS